MATLMWCVKRWWICLTSCFPSKRLMKTKVELTWNQTAKGDFVVPPPICYTQCDNLYSNSNNDNIDKWTIFNIHSFSSFSVAIKLIPKGRKLYYIIIPDEYKLFNEVPSKQGTSEIFIWTRNLHHHHYHSGHLHCKGICPERTLIPCIACI